MEIMFYIGAALIAITLVVKLVSIKKRHKAASNVVFSKYTFNKQNIEKQNSIHDKAIEMVLASNATKMDGFANEVERFGWYALAMDALGIHSAVPDNPCWYKVKNPYSAIIPGDAMIYKITDALQQQYNIKVEISGKKGYPDKAATEKKENKKGKKKRK